MYEGLICAAQEGSLVCVRASNGFSPYVILSMMAWVFAFISMFGSKVASVIPLFMFLGLFIAMLTWQKRRQFVEDLCALLDGERLRGGKSAARGRTDAPACLQAPASARPPP